MILAFIHLMGLSMIWMLLLSDLAEPSWIEMQVKEAIESVSLEDAERDAGLQWEAGHSSSLVNDMIRLHQIKRAYRSILIATEGPADFMDVWLVPRRDAQKNLVWAEDEAKRKRPLPEYSKDLRERYERQRTELPAGLSLKTEAEMSFEQKAQEFKHLYDQAEVLNGLALEAQKILDSFKKHDRFRTELDYTEKNSPRYYEKVRDTFGRVLQQMVETTGLRTPNAYAKVAYLDGPLSLAALAIAHQKHEAEVLIYMNNEILTPMYWQAQTNCARSHLAQGAVR